MFTAFSNYGEGGIGPLHPNQSEELDGEWELIKFLTSEELDELREQNPNFIEDMLNSVIGRIK